MCLVLSNLLSLVDSYREVMSINCYSEAPGRRAGSLEVKRSVLNASERLFCDQAGFSLAERKFVVSRRKGTGREHR